MKLGDKSIQPEDRLIRIYPEKNLFSHIIGQIDDNNSGISGLEKSFDGKLKTSKEPFILSLDKDIQYLVRNELIKFNKVFETKGSAAILMNVNNGEILSIVSLPDFNPNMREKISDINYINRATKKVRFSSVFKTTLAAAFKKVLNQKPIYQLTKILDLCWFPIRKYDNKIPSFLLNKF